MKAKNTRYVISFLLPIFIFVTACFYTEDNKTIVLKTQVPSDFKGEVLEPKGNLTEQIIERKYYKLGYVPSAKQAEWTFYKLTKDMVERAVYMIRNKEIKRSSKFFEDDTVIGERATLLDYKKSGYDRGHLVPSMDMSFTEEAMLETYYLTNMSPQIHKFNAGIWSNLEKKVRDWAAERELYVTGAGVLTSNEGTIGVNEVLIPKYFYKIIVGIDKDQNFNVIAFLIPHLNRKSNKLKDYVVEIKEIEDVTQIEFMYKLPSELRDALISRKEVKEWSL